MFDQAIRIPKQVVLKPVAKRLSFSPSLITLVGLLIGLLAAVLAGFDQTGWAVGLWAVNRFLDGLDGEIARAHNRKSDLGGYFDIMADFVIYAAIPVALVLANPSVGTWIATVILLASFYINAGSWMYLSSILEKRGFGATTTDEKTSVTMPTGLIEGTETVIFFTLFLLFPGLTFWLFLIMASLVLVTTIQRLIWASKVL